MYVCMCLYTYDIYTYVCMHTERSLCTHRARETKRETEGDRERERKGELSIKCISKHSYSYLYAHIPWTKQTCLAFWRDLHCAFHGRVLYLQPTLEVRMKQQLQDLHTHVHGKAVGVKTDFYCPMVRAESRILRSGFW